MTKDEYIKLITEEYINKNFFKVDYTDFTKPWGSYFALKETEAKRFANLYFPNLVFNFSNPLKPKFLLVEPKKRLSWQYHLRRSEFWKVLSNSVYVSLNKTDDEKTADLYVNGSIIEIPVKIRHRLIGADDWGLVAEIWKHENPQNPSDENDIVRLQDDFFRAS